MAAFIDLFRSMNGKQTRITIRGGSLVVAERLDFELEVERLYSLDVELTRLRVGIERKVDTESRQYFLAMMRIEKPRLVLSVSTVEYSLLALASELVEVAERQLMGRSDEEGSQTVSAKRPGSNSHRKGLLRSFIESLSLYPNGYHKR